MAKIGSLEPLLASKRITDAAFIKGGYFVVKDTDERDRLRVATDTRDGTIVDGSLCYCQADGKFYSYDGKTNAWVEKNNTIKMSAIDDELSKDLPEGRVYNEKLHDALKQSDRVYAEKQAEIDESGNIVYQGATPLYYISANSSPKWSPIGYKSLNDMIADYKWTGATIEKGVHYTTVTADDGSVSYHPRLCSLVARTPTGSIRIEGAPKDSTDAVPKSYFDGFMATKINVNSIAASRTVDNVLYRVKNGGKYDGMPLSFFVRGGSYVPLSVGGQLMGETPENGDDKTLVNKSYLNDKIKISGTVKTAIGGIAKDTVYKDASVADILVDLLFPYEPFSFDIFYTSDGGGNFDYGTTKTVKTATLGFTVHSEHYPITSVKIGTTEGGSDLYEGTSAKSGVRITLTNQLTLDGTENVTIYCTLSDGTTTLQKSVSYTFGELNYIVYTDTTAVPTEARVSFKGTSISTNTSGAYVWFFMSKEYEGYSIWRHVPNSDWRIKWDTTDVGVRELTNTGQSYHTYRTKEKHTFEYSKLELSDTDSNTYPNYVMVTDDEATPIDVSSATSIGLNGKDADNISASEQYVWFFVESSNTYDIWHKDGDWWKPFDTTYSGKVLAKTFANTRKAYDVYRTTNKVSVANANLELRTSDPNTYPNYYAVTGSIKIPTDASSATSIGTDTEATIETKDNTYVWFLTPEKEDYKIFQWSKSFGWGSASETIDGIEAYAGEVELTIAPGLTKTYYAYRTVELMASIEKFCISVEDL